jgi:hypothetical protein
MNPIPHLEDFIASLHKAPHFLSTHLRLLLRRHSGECVLRSSRFPLHVSRQKRPRHLSLVRPPNRAQRLQNLPQVRRYRRLIYPGKAPRIHPSGFQSQRLNFPPCSRARPIATSVSRISATSAGLARLNCAASSAGAAAPLRCNAASTAWTRSAIFAGHSALAARAGAAVLGLGFFRINQSGPGWWTHPGAVRLPRIQTHTRPLASAPAAALPAHRTTHKETAGCSPARTPSPPSTAQ